MCAQLVRSMVQSTHPGKPKVIRVFYGGWNSRFEELLEALSVKKTQSDAPAELTEYTEKPKRDADQEAGENSHLPSRGPNPLFPDCPHHASQWPHKANNVAPE